MLGDVSGWLSVVGNGWLVVSDSGLRDDGLLDWLGMVSDSWLVVGDGGLGDDGLLDWDDGLGDDGWGVGSAFLGDDGVESVDGVGSVVNDTAGSISFDQGVLSLDVVSVAGFVLGLGVAGQRVMDVIGVRVLGVCVVVFNVSLGNERWGGDDLLLDNSWLSISDRLGVGDWSLGDDASAGNGNECAEDDELLGREKILEPSGRKLAKSTHFECHFSGWGLK